MLKSLLVFELRFLSQQFSFYLMMLVFFIMAFFVTGRLGHGGKVFINSPDQVTAVYLFLGMYLPIVTSIFTVNSVLRDDTNKATEMIYACPIIKTQFVFSRYLGLVLIVACPIMIAAVAMMLRTYFPFMIDGHFTDNSPTYYLWTIFVFLLPNILFFAALSLAVACFTRSVIATYLSGLVIYILYMLSAIFVDVPMFGGALPTDSILRQFAALIDPFGMSVYEITSEYWTAAEKNSQLINLSGNLLLNRILWLSMTGLILLCVLFKFKLNLEYLAKAKKSAVDKAVTDKFKKLAENNQRQNKPMSLATRAYKNLAPSKSKKRHWLALKSNIKLEINYLTKSYAFWVVIGLWSVLVAGEIFALGKSADFTSPLYPTTSRILARFLFDVLPRLSLFVLVFYTADMVWREKDLKMNAFIDASPTKGLVFFLSKLIALSLIPLLFISIAISIGVLFQLLNGYQNFQPLLYLSSYYFGGLPLLFNISLCLFVQVLLPNKTLGMFVSALILLFVGTNLGHLIGLEHQLWRFAKTPELNYSDMNGYGLISFSFALYMIYWGSLAIILCLLGFGLWRRGCDISFASRLKQISPQLGKPGLIAGAICLLVFLTSGGYIFYQTNIKANYYSKVQSELFRVEYERQFQKVAELPQPEIESVNTQIDLYPSEQRFKATGQYQLVNRESVGIDEVYVDLSNDFDLRHLSVTDAQGNSAELNSSYSTLGVYYFKLAKTLLPQEKLTLDFILQQQQSGFADFSVRSRVTQNATLLYSSSQFPQIGYLKQKQLQNNKLRKEYGLENLPLAESIEQSIASTQGRFVDEGQYINFETTISTAFDQTALAPGSLINQWQQDNRAYYHYKSDSPIRNAIFYLSSRYASVKEDIGEIATTVYYFPQHHHNIGRMQQGIKDSLKYQIANFGDYPHKQFSQVEVAEYTGLSGYAAPTMTLMSEHAGFTYDLTNADDYDQVYRRSAHEVAHQWWGHIISPAEIDEGSMLLVETLARYSESMIMKKIYGNEMALRFINFEMNRYFIGRADETEIELPLYRTRNEQRYLMYSKGAVAMYALQNIIGEDRVNIALKSFVEKHAYPNPSPTSLDLLNAFYQVAPEHIEVIDEWFRRSTYVELSIEKTMVSKLENNLYQLNLDISFIKKQVDAKGEEQTFKTTQLLEIEITLGAEGDNKKIILRREVDSGDNQLQIELDEMPVTVSLDPRSLLLNKYKSKASRDLILAN